MDSVFNIQSLDRNLIKWEDNLLILTPVEKHGDMWFKREDKFAPLGYGSINGTKLRQCISLINEYYHSHPNGGVISGAVTGSPQHPMVATICKHYSLDCINIVGTKKIDEHKNLVIAKNMGARFEISSVGYAKTLESFAFKLRDSKYPDYYVLETNITLNHNKHPATAIEAFHYTGSRQVMNIPEFIDTLIVPIGSCNSVTSVLYGLAQFPTSIRKVILMGIGSYGSSDPDYIRRRLDIVASAKNIDVTEKFNFNFNKNTLNFNSNQIQVNHYDLNGTGYCKYADLMPFNYHGIEMHPRYEGKCWNYMKDNQDIFGKYMNNTTMFWIVGSEPQR